jgi:hypothetical protein
MKTVKLFFAIIAVTLTGTMSFATSGITKTMIQQQSETSVNLKAQLDETELMEVVISNENGDVIYSEVFENYSGMISKTFDFSETRYGGYYMEVFINDELVKTTVINNGEVSVQDSYHLVLN